MATHLVLEVSEHGADQERLEELAHSLRRDLLELDVDAVERLSLGQAPPGSKGLDIAAAGAMIVVAKESVEMAARVMETIRSWLRRSPGPARTIKVTLNGQTLELSAATEAQQQQLVDKFLHAAVHQPETGS
jgi:hypothetical protein